MAVSPWIKIGLVGRPHGLRGEFFVAGREDLVPSDYKDIAIGSDPGWAEKAEVLQIRTQGKQSVMRCSASTSRDTAEALCGRPIWVKREQVEINEDEHYLWADLIGRQVDDCNGVKLGHVLSVYNVGASDILVVRDDKGRFLEVAMAPTYFDADGISRGVHSGRLTLLVAGEVFSDLWQESRS